MRPTSKMISSTDPNNDMCEATFDVNGITPEIKLTLKNKDYFTVANMIQQAYNLGKTDGKIELSYDIKQNIRSYLV